MGVKLKQAQSGIRPWLKAFICALFLALSLHHNTFVFPVAEAISDSALEPPQLLTPADNAVQNGTTIDYRWQSSDSAEAYVFEAYTDPALTQLYERRVITENSVQLSEVHGANIWWRVKAVFKTDSNSLWSNVQSVIIDNVAPNVQRISPSEAASHGVTAIQFELKDNYPFNLRFKLNGLPLNAPVVRYWAVNDHIKQAELTLDTSGLANGTQYLTVQASDIAGNTSDELTVMLIVNNTPVTEAPSQTHEALQPLPIQNQAYIAPLLGGERVVGGPVAALPQPQALTQSANTANDDVQASTVQAKRGAGRVIGTSWPMWLGAGVIVSGSGWWLWLGRRQWGA